jgi:hypothetical protein
MPGLELRKRRFGILWKPVEGQLQALARRDLSKLPIKSGTPAFQI